MTQKTLLKGPGFYPWEGPFADTFTDEAVGGLKIVEKETKTPGKTQTGTDNVHCCQCSGGSKEGPFYEGV